MEAWPEVLLLFGHLRSLGGAPFPVPCGALQATLMHHRGATVGGFFLGGKEGGFTDAFSTRMASATRCDSGR